MFDQRLQILVSSEQRRRWEAEAKRTGVSVGRLIREAVDRHLGSADRGGRVEALDSIRAMRGWFLTQAELERLVEEERTRAAER